MITLAICKRVERTRSKNVATISVLWLTLAPGTRRRVHDENHPFLKKYFSDKIEMRVDICTISVCCNHAT